jgi:chromate transporter
MMLTLSAFGGPYAHIALMQERLVERRQYLTHEALMELNALCQFLPGPTSTQTITAVGLKLGGVRLALLTLLIWILPATLLMTFMAVLVYSLEIKQLNMAAFRWLPPVAVGFVAASAWRLVERQPWKGPALLILGMSVSLSLALVSSYTFPLVLILGGIAQWLWQERKGGLGSQHSLAKVRWFYFRIYALLFGLAVLLGNGFHSREILLFENFYRFGSLVFGGGQVLLPMMYEHFVTTRQYLTTDQFLIGYGLAQGVPGPVFSQAAYMGGLILQSRGVLFVLLGSLLGAVAIFTPGALLILFVYPIWNDVKRMPRIQAALQGVQVAAIGLIITAIVLLMKPLGYSSLNLSLIGLTALFNHRWGVPALLIVVLSLTAGLVSELLALS